MIQVKSITAGYGSLIALREVTFDVREGEFVGILGPNGSGKSTLLRVISGIMNPWNGEVWIQGQKISGMGRREIARVLAVVHQEPLFTFEFSVLEIVLMGRNPYLKRFQREGKEDLRVAREVMELTDTLHLENRPIHALSSWERQRVVIARALAQKPKILLLDEPTAHLDIHHQFEILELLNRLNREGLTLLWVSHDLNLASDYCERLFLLKAGRLITSGSPADVLQFEVLREVYQIHSLIEKNPVTGKTFIFPIRRVEP